MVCQQVLDKTEYAKWVKNLFIEAQEHLENYNKIKDPNLIWNKDPAIKETAKQLGVFETPPTSTEPLNLDVFNLNPEIQQTLE